MDFLSEMESVIFPLESLYLVSIYWLNKTSTKMKNIFKKMEKYFDKTSSKQRRLVRII